MIIPIIIPSATDKCPKCQKDEDIKQVCRHCGYEYVEEESNGWDYVRGLAVIFLTISCFLWVVLTLMDWIAGVEHGTTLVDVLKGQVEWVKLLRIW